MRSHFLHPSPILASFIEAYVDFRLRPEEASGVAYREHRLLPAPGTSIAVGYGETVGYTQIEGSPVREVPSCAISGYWTRPKTYRLLPPGGVFIICLKPWGLARFTRLPIAELTDQSIHLEYAFGRDLATELQERVVACSNVAERKEVVEEVLLRVLAAAERSGRIDILPDGAERAIELIAQTGGTIRVDDLAGEFGYGRKRLDRMFQREIGWSPKKICRIIRFQHALRLLPQVNSLAEAAYELGYFDQAHFIREFRELSGRTPGDYLRTHQRTDIGRGYSRVVRSSHLYNTVYE